MFGCLMVGGTTNNNHQRENGQNTEAYGLMEIFVVSFRQDQTLAIQFHFFFSNG